MRVAVLGRTALLYETMKLLSENGHEIVVIGTCKAAPEYSVTEIDFQKYAEEKKIPFFCKADLNDDYIHKLLVEASADIAVSVNWLTIIGSNTIDCFKYGILNAHAGDLPRFRGNACPNWAILLGEKQVGVTVHFMEPGELDSGDMLVKRFFPLTQHTRIGQVYEWLEGEIPKMFLEAIEGLENNSITPQKQSKNKENILRVYPRRPEDGYINWSDSAEYIERLINASSEPFEGAFTFYRGKRMIIWRACASEWDVPSMAVPGQVVERSSVLGKVYVACGEGRLCIEEIEYAGKRCRPYECISSMRDRLGKRIL